MKTQFRGRRKIIIVTFDIKIPGLCQPEVIEGHPGVAVEHLVPVIVPEDELLPGLQRGHGVVALEPLAVGGEVVQDPGTRLRAQLPGPGGQVNKVGFLPTTLASLQTRASNKGPHEGSLSWRRLLLLGPSSG